MKYMFATLMMAFTVLANACLEFNEPWLQFAMKPNQTFSDSNGMVVWKMQGDKIQGVHGMTTGTLTNNVLYACDGTVVARKSGNSIYDNTGMLMYRVMGNNIETANGVTVFRITGNSVYDSSGMLYGRLSP